MDEKKNVKICFAASSGGHYEQLMMLKPLMEKYDSFVITEKTDYSAEAKGEKTYYMKQVNRREKDFIWRMIQNAWKSIGIYRKEKPDVVICTGVLAMIPICLIWNWKRSWMSRYGRWSPHIPAMTNTVTSWMKLGMTPIS